MDCSTRAGWRLRLRYELFVSSSLSFFFPLRLLLGVYYHARLYGFAELGAIEPTGHRRLSLLSDLSKALEASVNNNGAAGAEEIVPRVCRSRRVVRETVRGVLDCRKARRRTDTAKLLNSNSWIGTNNGFGLVLELVKNFISMFKSCSSRLQLRSPPQRPLLHLRAIRPCLFRGS